MKEIKNRKIVIVNAANEKEIIEVDVATGEYCIPENILWDEKNGPIPSDVLQAVSDQKLVTISREEKKQQALNKAFSDLKELDLKSDLSASDIQKAIKALVRIKKNGA